MDPQVLQPGDRAIDLITIARRAGLTSGALTGFFVAWLATGEMSWTMILGLVGAIAGEVSGRLLGHFRYMKDGRRLVVKQGPSAQQSTVAAALSASLPVAILVWLGCLTIIGGPAPSLVTGAACLFIGISTGVLVGRAASWL